MVFQCVNIHQVPWEVLKTTAGLGFQHLPWDLANVNACISMFNPYSEGPDQTAQMHRPIWSYAVRIYSDTFSHGHIFQSTMNPRYNDSICSHKCCHYNEFAVVKNP